MTKEKDQKENADRAAEKCVREIMRLESKKQARAAQEAKQFAIDRMVYQKRRRRSC